MGLGGTAAELLGLVDLLQSGTGTVELDRLGGPSPYDSLVSRLAVTRTSGPVVVRYLAGLDVLDIRGGDEQLDLLALNVQAFAEQDDVTSHAHIEYFPDHDYLDETSVPLVITLTT